MDSDINNEIKIHKNKVLKFLKRFILGFFLTIISFMSISILLVYVYVVEFLTIGEFMYLCNCSSKMVRFNNNLRLCHSNWPSSIVFQQNGYIKNCIYTNKFIL